MSPEKAETVIFLHIMKTAGVSLNEILTRQYPPGTTLSIYDKETNPFRTPSPNVFKDMPELNNIEKIRKIRLIRGHFAFGIHDLLPQKCSYMTMLRHPVSRFLSHYYYLQDKVQNSSNGKVRKKITPDIEKERQKVLSMTLEEFVTTTQEKSKDNHQTRVLAGTNGVPYSGSDVNEEIVKIAEENLNNYFPVVGILEDFDASLLALQKHYGWTNVFYKVYNQTKPVKNKYKREEVPQKLLDRISEMEKFDIQLYENARKRFQKEFFVSGTDFEEEIKKFRLMNQSLYGKLSCFYATTTAKVLRKLVGAKW